MIISSKIIILGRFNYALSLGWGFFFHFYQLKTLLGTELFTLPTISSEPTIQAGDYIMADLWAYEDTPIDYGDIVAFELDDGVTYLFRVVGLPNDEIAVNDNIVTINGITCTSRYIRDTTIVDGNLVDELELLEETLPNAHRHQIYRNKRKSSLADFTTFPIPADSYFVMGDHRDFARDSRVLGSISKRQISGKILYSYFGKDGSRINVNFSNK